MAALHGYIQHRRPEGSGCDSLGNDFVSPGRCHYTHNGVPGTGDTQVRAARRPCEAGSEGTFSGGPAYTCSNILS